MPKAGRDQSRPVANTGATLHFDRRDHAKQDVPTSVVTFVPSEKKIT